MDIEIQTKYGKVKGFKKDGVCKWFGIPYAKPPVKELRFRRAVECEPWEGVKDCTKLKGRCIQFKLPNTPVKTDSEDCLHLNIWRQDNDEKKLPVYFWIHGGYLHNGSGDDEMHHGESFAKEGVLYITINYRLGPLGCYDFSVFNKELFDSNCFLTDQIMALKWVRDNIEAFGGDPNNVTIAGESAGSSSVCALLVSPPAKGLFHKAICQSGPPDACSNIERENNLFTSFLKKFLKYLKIDEKDVEKLRDLDIEEIRKAAVYLADNHEDYGDENSSMPGIAFDDLYPSDLFDRIKNGSITDVKLIIGTTHDEGTYLYSMEECPMNWREIKDFCLEHGLLSKFIDFKQLYCKLPSESDQCCAFITDYNFLINSCFFADYFSKYNDTWMYRFDYPPPLFASIDMNATHGCDIYIATNTLKGRGASIWSDMDPKVLKYLVDSMHGSFISFAKTGDPNGPHLDINWEKYDTETRKTIIFDEKNKLLVNPNYEKLAIWEEPV
ncbi:para-nitrobenzyl esterase [Anaeromyces robustus]|uniref:Carboxylic ester hydrolase n=1 Tax=Anaeromyces robustus TaxID=1754192 RepID=A0A1Y1X008_9FUNG|nr:para-nitrobenzyl esterase [Anaeromyces robustus]|eukprot:ORX78684.1 para-nitrobenzyl esterase [Anaeromyces robustus]